MQWPGAVTETRAAAPVSERVQSDVMHRELKKSDARWFILKASHCLTFRVG
jgi:hypothetical protein